MGVECKTSKKNIEYLKNYLRKTSVKHTWNWKILVWYQFYWPALLNLHRFYLHRREWNQNALQVHVFDALHCSKSFETNPSNSKRKKIVKQNKTRTENEIWNIIYSGSPKTQSITLLKLSKFSSIFVESWPSFGTLAWFDGTKLFCASQKSIRTKRLEREQTKTIDANNPIDSDDDEDDGDGLIFVLFLIILSILLLKSWEIIQRKFLMEFFSNLRSEEKKVRE